MAGKIERDDRQTAFDNRACRIQLRERLLFVERPRRADQRQRPRFRRVLDGFYAARRGKFRGRRGCGRCASALAHSIKLVRKPIERSALTPRGALAHSVPRFLIFTHDIPRCEENHGNIADLGKMLQGKQSNASFVLINRYQRAPINIGREQVNCANHYIADLVGS